MKILLDSSIIIDAIRLRQILPALHDYSISDITITELYSGKSIWESPKNKRIVDSILTHLNHLHTSTKISQLAGQIRSKYKANVPDAIIAATAITHKLPLATINTKDFISISHLKLIKI